MTAICWFLTSKRMSWLQLVGGTMSDRADRWCAYPVALWHCGSAYPVALWHCLSGGIRLKILDFLNYIQFALYYFYEENKTVFVEVTLEAKKHDMVRLSYYFILLLFYPICC